jgi:hypothetical protein
MQEEALSKVHLKSIEKECLDTVFNRLCSLEEQPSSDEDSNKKKYLSKIQKKVGMKRMKVNSFNNTNFKSTIISSINADKKFKEDEPKNNSPMIKNAPAVEEPKKKIGVKAIRKMIRFLKQEISKEEMDLMIWVFICIKKRFLFGVSILQFKIISFSVKQKNLFMFFLKYKLGSR